jgi:hypothetical protein
MKKAALSRNVVTAIFLSLAVPILSFGSAHATGSISIGNCQDLQKIGNDIDYPLDGSYVLVNDIDCSDTANWNGGEGFVPIGNSSTPFIGVIDGNNFKISELTINLPGQSNVGLIGYSDQAVINNLTLSGGSVTGYLNVGGLAGSERSITLTNISSSQALFGHGYTGGIVGWNRDQQNSNVDTTITNNHFSGEITVTGTTGCYAIGGIMGDNDGDAAMADSSNSGNITSTCTSGEYFGGIVGDSDGLLSIANTYSTGNIDSISDSVGGITGWANHIILANTYAKGNITGTTTVGGLVGFLNNGPIQGHDVSSSITNSYFSGLISSQDPNSTGGLLGQIAMIQGFVFTNLFWNTEISTIDNGCGVYESVTCELTGYTGVTAQQLRTQTTFTNSNWNFSQIWGICTSLNDGMPYLLSQHLTCNDSASNSLKAPVTGIGINDNYFPTILLSVFSLVTISGSLLAKRHGAYL